MLSQEEFDERLKIICNRWDVSINKCRKIHIDLMNNTNFGDIQCLDIIEDYLANEMSLDSLIQFFGLEKPSKI